MSESTMEAIDAIDNAIDEALDDEPTPPKRQRTYDCEVSVVFFIYFFYVIWNTERAHCALS